jgi:hypothetical protein
MGKKASLEFKLRNFKKVVNRAYPISKMILFGSRASGKVKSVSDIDLIIVSPKFKGLDFIQRGSRMYDYWDLKHPVDFLCYTPEEFKKLSKIITIVRSAAQEGIEI